MLCHKHPADGALAACNRCQRGLCQSCATTFSQRLCTHCVDEHASARLIGARRTLWMIVPAFALGWTAAWYALAPTGLSERARLYLAWVAGSSALGLMLGVRRYRTPRPLSGHLAAAPEDERPFLSRWFEPVRYGLLGWPWLLWETLVDRRRAGALRALLPAEERSRTFGAPDLALVGVTGAAALALVATLQAPTEVRAELDPPPLQVDVQPELGASGRTSEQEAEAQPVEAVAVEQAAQAEPTQHADPAEAEPAREPEDAERAQLAQERTTPEPRRSRRRRREAAPEEAQEPHAPALRPEEPVAAQPIASEPEAPEPAPVAEPAPRPPREIPRRFAPNSELAKQYLNGSPSVETYTTPSGRVIIKAPPPSP